MKFTPADKNKFQRIQMSNSIFSIPAIPLRGLCIFPGMPIALPVARNRSVEAANKAMRDDGRIFLVMQKNIEAENPVEADIFTVGVIAKIHEISKDKAIPDASKVVVEGICRAKMHYFSTKGRYYSAEVEVLDEYFDSPFRDYPEEVQRQAYLIGLRRRFEDFCDFMTAPPPELTNTIFDSDELSIVCDTIASTLVPVTTTNERQALLESVNIYKRAMDLSVLLERTVRGLEFESELQDKVQERMDRNQREYYLHEEMKAISEELEELCDDDSTGLKKKIMETQLPDEVREKLLDELSKYKKQATGSPDAAVSRAYIEKCLELPWCKESKENSDINKAKKVLDRDHYGLEKVKERITEMLASRIISKDIKGQIICLAGPPGVGKTSIAKSIAAASGRKYVRIALGGMKDESEIRGHRRTYVGAMPGRLVNALIEAKTMNPLILLDEIDKLSSSFTGDPASALLEVLDGEQNMNFRDNFIELPIDLSQVLFVTTANDIGEIPAPLRDRMEIIQLPGYTYEEKFHIAKKHLIPKQLKEHGLTKKDLKISDAAIRGIVDGWTREAGVRILERQIAKLCRKQALRLAEGNTDTLNVKPDVLEDLLGVRKYRPEDISHDDEIGVVNGLAWTAVGGEVLRTEAAILAGKGQIELTGCLGDVMKESAKIAVSLVRSRADKYGIDPEFYTKKDIHLHFPEGAVPKDGPSAGVTITTALISALSGRQVRGDVAMTGEITLRGRVLSIGGLREKSMGAYKEGIRTIIIPEGNVPDIEEVDKAVRDKLKFVPAKTIDDVLSASLI